MKNILITMDVTVTMIIINATLMISYKLNSKTSSQTTVLYIADGQIIQDVEVGKQQSILS